MSIYVTMEEKSNEITNHSVDDTDVNDTSINPDFKQFQSDEIKCFKIEFDDQTYYNLRKISRKPAFYTEQETTTKVEKEKSKKSKRNASTDDFFKRCDLCRDITFMESHWNNHRTLHSEYAFYICVICKEKFTTNNQLKDHKEKHKDETFLCVKCKLAFSDHRLYLTHLVTHLRNQPFNCYECHYKFSEKKKLATHIHSHYSEVTEVCWICNKSVAKRTFKNHLAEHDNIQCVECHKMIKKLSYRVHMSVHTGIKPFQCFYCGKGFSTFSQRNIHMRLHTNIKPHKCKICDDTFRQYTDLQRHISSKHRALRYECDTCGKVYKDKQYFITHLKTHTNYKPYKCAQCPEAFTMSASLKCHVYTKHVKGKRFHCSICDKRFPHLSDIAKHKRTKGHLRMQHKLNNSD